MGIWAEIKFAINSSLGKNLRPLDKIVAEIQHTNYYNTISHDVIVNGDRNGKILVVGEDDQFFLTSNEANIVEVVMPNYVGLNSNALHGATALEKFVIPPTVSSINPGVFGNCTSLKNINIHDYVTEIYGRAFSGCTSLRNIRIGVGIKKIYSEAFSGIAGVNIRYNGTKSQWEAIEKEDGWNGVITIIHCKDGTVTY